MKRGILLVLWACAGCNGHLTVSQLAPLEDAVLAVDEEDSLARVVQVDGASTSHVDVALSEGAVSLVGAQAATALVLTQGRLGDAQHESVPSELVAIDRTGETNRWTFQGQYERAVVSRDARYAITLSPRGRLVIENRVEVVDLTQPPGDANPLSLSLRSLGGESPSSAEISEPIAWTGGSELRVAALFANGQLSLFDLDAPDVAPITIPTTTDASSVGPQPVEGIFVGSELVLRPASGSQILVVSLEPSDGAQRFDVSVRTLAASAGIAELAVDTRSASPRLLVLGGLSLDVIDLETGIATSLRMPDAYAHILLFEGTAPGDATTRHRVALYGPSASSVGFVELGDGPAEVLDASELPLAALPYDVIADPMRARLIAFEPASNYAHPVSLDVAQSAGRRPASVIDLQDRSAIALEAAPDVDRAVASVALTDVWIAGDEGYVNRFDLATHEQEERWLPQDVDTLLPLFGATQRVLAFSSIRSGSFAVLEPGADPRSVAGAW